MLTSQFTRYVLLNDDALNSFWISCQPSIRLALLSGKALGPWVRWDCWMSTRLPACYSRNFLWLWIVWIDLRRRLQVWRKWNYCERNWKGGSYWWRCLLLLRWILFLSRVRRVMVFCERRQGKLVAVQPYLRKLLGWWAAKESVRHLDVSFTSLWADFGKMGLLTFSLLIQVGSREGKTIASWVLCVSFFDLSMFLVVHFIFILILGTSWNKERQACIKRFRYLVERHH